MYWQCVFTFCWSSTRTNPGIQHLVYTNDEEICTIAGVSIQGALEDMGVEIVHLPFEEFDPGDRSRKFRNAFYKLEVVKGMSGLAAPSLLVDSDCLWHKASSDLDDSMLQGDRLLLQDTYQRSSSPELREPHNVSMLDFGDLYRRIDPAYSTDRPIWYGGEIIGGTPEILARVSGSYSALFSELMSRPAADLNLANGDTIFDNDEYFSSFVFNNGDYDILDTWGRFSARVETRYPRRRTNSGLRDIPVWHLPYEKTRGLSALFSAVIHGQLDDARKEDLTSTLGGYVGAPRRTISRQTDAVDLAKWLARKVLRS